MPLTRTFGEEFGSDARRQAVISQGHSGGKASFIKESAETPDRRDCAYGCAPL
jgi:hypothetical protein